MTNSIKKLRRVFAACTAACMACLSFPQGTLLAAETEEPDFSVLGAVGVFTAEETEQIAAVIYDGLENHDARINLNGSGMPHISTDVESIESLGSIFRSVVAGWDVGVLTTKNSMPYMMNTSGVVAIGPKYMVDDADYDAVYKSIIAEMDAFVADVDPNWSDAEKALFIHEKMAECYTYDYNEYETTEETNLRHTAYGLLERDTAVCEGYAWLYGLLLRRVGVESMMVTSVELCHAWNLIEIDGSWYHTDVTWDDGYNTTVGLVQHTSFLKSDDAMVASYHDSTDWELITGNPVSDMNVSDKYDNAFWANAISTIQHCPDGTWLAILPADQDPSTGVFTKHVFDAETGTSEYTSNLSLSDRWFALGSTVQYYNASYIVTDFYNGDLYYTTPQNMFALRGNSVVWLFGLTEDQKAQGYIYGMYIEGDTMHYYVAAAAGMDAQEYTVDLNAYQAQIDAVAGTTATEETTTTTEETTTEETTTTTEETTTEETTTTTEETTTEEATTTTEETTTEETTTTTEETTTEETTTTTEETTTTTEETTTAEPETVTVKGDANGDGAVNIVDVIAVQQYLLGRSDISEQEAENSDLTRDGVVDAFDLALLKRLLLKARETA